MFTTTDMTEEKAFEQDVKTMSYEELMDAIRYLDAQRCALSKTPHTHDMKSTHKDHRQDKILQHKEAA